VNAIVSARRDFLRGRAARPGPLRPPWSLPEPEFADRCTRCGDCERACPQQILVRGAGGFPEVDFSRGECTFCGHCAEVCGAGAFASHLQAPWRALAAISNECLARRGVVCQSCADSCGHDALRFEYRPPERVPVPLLDAAACTGCGACVRACPVHAIRVQEPAVAAT
jgi:ferredoxin-type protein NapF